MALGLGEQGWAKDQPNFSEPNFNFNKENVRGACAGEIEKKIKQQQLLHFDTLAGPPESKPPSSESASPTALFTSSGNSNCDSPNPIFHSGSNLINEANGILADSKPAPGVLGGVGQDGKVEQSKSDQKRKMGDQKALEDAFSARDEWTGESSRSEQSPFLAKTVEQRRQWNCQGQGQKRGVKRRPRYAWQEDSDSETGENVIFSGSGNCKSANEGDRVAASSYRETSAENGTSADADDEVWRRRTSSSSLSLSSAPPSIKRDVDNGVDDSVFDYAVNASGANDGNGLEGGEVKAEAVVRVSRAWNINAQANLASFKTEYCISSVSESDTGRCETENDGTDGGSSTDKPTVTGAKTGATTGAAFFSHSQILSSSSSSSSLTASSSIRSTDVSSSTYSPTYSPHSVGATDGRARSRVLTMQDFLDLRVIGQFNLGFIIAELRNDLYILDQHACDEKIRFEGLQHSTSIHQQPLIVPLPLEATASEEDIIEEHLHIFERNGFKIKVDPEKPCGRRLSVSSVPFSKSVQFGLEDIHELASLIADCSGGMSGYSGDAPHISKLLLKNDAVKPIGADVRSDVTRTEADAAYANADTDTDTPSGDSMASNHPALADRVNKLRLPKLLSMYASRACRSAVMIGTALKVSEMRTIVRKLSNIEQPWNCPHGRRTMHHLVDLESFIDTNSTSETGLQFQKKRVRTTANTDFYEHSAII